MQIRRKLVLIIACGLVLGANPARAAEANTTADRALPSYSDAQLEWHVNLYCR